MKLSNLIFLIGLFTFIACNRNSNSLTPQTEDSKVLQSDYFLGYFATTTFPTDGQEVTWEDFKKNRVVWKNLPIQEGEEDNYGLNIYVCAYISFSFLVENGDHLTSQNGLERLQIFINGQEADKYDSVTSGLSDLMILDQPNLKAQASSNYFCWNAENYIIIGSNKVELVFEQSSGRKVYQSWDFNVID